MAFIQVGDIIINENRVSYLKPDGADLIVCFTVKRDAIGQELRFSGEDAAALKKHFEAKAKYVGPGVALQFFSIEQK